MISNNVACARGRLQKLLVLLLIMKKITFHAMAMSTKKSLTNLRMKWSAEDQDAYVASVLMEKLHS